MVPVGKSAKTKYIPYAQISVTKYYSRSFSQERSGVIKFVYTVCVLLQANANVRRLETATEEITCGDRDVRRRR